MATSALRAVLYCRISEDTDASTSVERQQADLHALADREGWQVVSALTDDGLSGRRTRAKALQAVDMLADGSADVLAVWKFDRFSRQGLSALVALFDALEARPAARFLALKDSLDSTTPAWRIVASVLAEVARMESENTRARVRSSIAHLKRSDRYPGGTVPLGYRAVPHPSGRGRALEVDPAEAAVLLDVAERVIAGSALNAEAVRLNTEGTLRPRRADAWKLQTLRQCLTGAPVVGRVTAGGEVLTDPITHLPRQVWPPAIPLDVWHAVRAAIDGRRRTDNPRARQARARLLSGLARCSSCGGLLYTRTNGQGLASYACTARSQGLVCAHGVAISADRLDEHVSSAFLATYGAEPVLEYRPDVAADSGPAVADLRDAVAALQSRAMAARGADRVALLEQLDGLEADLDVELARPASIWDRWVPTGLSYAETYATAEVDRRRALLGSEVAAVVIGPGTRGRTGLDPSRVKIDWHDRGEG